MKKIIACTLLLSFPLVAYETAYQAAQEFKKMVSEGRTNNAAQQQAARLIQNAMDTFFVKESGIVTGMIQYYFTVFGESPFATATQKSTEQRIAILEQQYAHACQEMKRVQHESQEWEMKWQQEKQCNEKLCQELAAVCAAMAEIAESKVPLSDATFTQLHEWLYEVGRRYGNKFEAGGQQKNLAKEKREELGGKRTWGIAYDTAYQAQQDFKRIVHQGKADPKAKQQAVHMMYYVMDKFFMQESAVVTGMLHHYYTIFGESPFAGENQLVIDHRVITLEQRYAQACEDIKQLRKESQDWEIKCMQEKHMNEKLNQELSTLHVVSPVLAASEPPALSTTLASLYERLKEAFCQYDVEFGSPSDLNNRRQEKSLEGHDARGSFEQHEAELRDMLEKWDAIMHKLRILSLKTEAYEKSKQTYEQREVEVKQVTEQRDALERQLRDFHRKFDSEQSKNNIAIHDAHAQLEAVRNQLADVKNQLALAKKQQHTAAPKNQELEKQLTAERAAYEGALSDERMQRQKLRQQVHELQKRLEVERTSYEKRIVSLEQEIVMLIERLPSGRDVKRPSLPATVDGEKEVSEQKEEERI